MKETSVLEVALNRIKMLRLCESKGRITLITVEELKLPLYEGDKISDEDIVDGIKYLHKKTCSKKEFINCIAPGKNMFIKYESLPPVTGAKLNQILQYEIDSHLLINKKDLTYDYQVTDDEAGNKLLLVGCRTDVINKQIAPVEEANLRINSVEFSPGALLNVFLYNYESDGKLTALLNIGANETDIVIQKGGVLHFARTIPGGFNLFIDALMEKFNVPQEEAERIIEEDVLIQPDTEEEDSSADEASRIAASQLDEILWNAQRYMQLWRRKTDLADKNIKKIYLSGHGSLLPDADKYVSHFLGTDTEILNPLRKIMVGPEAEDAKFSASSLAMHIGAGLGELTRTRININLLPEEKKEEINLVKKRRYFILSTILTITILFTPLIHVYLSRIYHLSRLQHAEEVLSKYEEYIPEVTELNEERKAILKRIGIMEGLRKKNTCYLENLSCISQLFPEDIYLDNFLVKLTPDKKVESFVLGGICRGYNEIEEIVDSLNSSSSFIRAKVSEITDVKDGEKLNFVISLTPADRKSKELQ